MNKRFQKMLDAAKQRGTEFPDAPHFSLDAVLDIARAADAEDGDIVEYLDVRDGNFRFAVLPDGKWVMQFRRAEFGKPPYSGEFPCPIEEAASEEIARAKSYFS